MSVLNIIADVVQAYVVVLFIRAILSWFPVHPGTTLGSAVRLLDVVTEPVLRPVRALIPPIRAGGTGIDLSFIVVILVAQIVVIPLLRG